MQNDAFSQMCHLDFNSRIAYRTLIVMSNHVALNQYALNQYDKYITDARLQ